MKFTEYTVLYSTINIFVKTKKGILEVITTLSCAKSDGESCTFLFVRHDSVRGCVRRSVGWSVRNAFVGGPRQDGEWLMSCMRNCSILSQRIHERLKKLNIAAKAA